MITQAEANIYIEETLDHSKTVLVKTAEKFVQVEKLLGEVKEKQKDYLEAFPAMTKSMTALKFEATIRVLEKAGSSFSSIGETLKRKEAGLQKAREENTTKIAELQRQKVAEIIQAVKAAEPAPVAKEPVQAKRGRSKSK